MSGQILALLAALLYAFSGIVTRRAVIKVPDVTAGTLLTVAVSVPFFLIILLVTGQVTDITGFSWMDYLWLSAAGVVHFVIGRSLYFYCTQLVGANIAAIFSRVAPLVPFILGVTILSEPLSWQLTIGVLLIITGATIAGLTPQELKGDKKPLSSTMVKAILVGIGAGLTFGVSAVFIKVGLSSSNLPVAGAFISFSAATLGTATSLVKYEKRTAFFSMSIRAVSLFCVTGLLVALAQLLRFIALGIAPVSVVAPLFSVIPIFTVLFSFLLNRRLELFSKTVVIGAIAVVAGTILLI